MSHVQPSLRWRLLAGATALVFGLIGTMMLLGTSLAADATATPAAPTGCAVASDTKGAPAGTPVAATDKCVQLDMHDIYFTGNYITIPADTDVTFVVTNQGAAAHDFSVNDHNNKDVKNLKINQAVDPGKTELVTINAPAGTYYFYCNVPGHEEAGMWGYIKVVKDGPISNQTVDDAKKAAGVS